MEEAFHGRVENAIIATLLLGRLPGYNLLRESKPLP